MTKDRQRERVRQRQVDRNKERQSMRQAESGTETLRQTDELERNKDNVYMHGLDFRF